MFEFVWLGFSKRFGVRLRGLITVFDLVFDPAFDSAFSMDLLPKRALRGFWSQSLLLCAAPDVIAKLKGINAFEVELIELLIRPDAKLTKT